MVIYANFDTFALQCIAMYEVELKIVRVMSIFYQLSLLVQPQ